MNEPISKLAIGSIVLMIAAILVNQFNLSNTACVILLASAISMNIKIAYEDSKNNKLDPVQKNGY